MGLMMMRYALHHHQQQPLVVVVVVVLMPRMITLIRVYHWLPPPQLPMGTMMISDFILDYGAADGDD